MVKRIIGVQMKTGIVWGKKYCQFDFRNLVRCLLFYKYFSTAAVYLF